MSFEPTKKLKLSTADQVALATGHIDRSQRQARIRKLRHTPPTVVVIKKKKHRDRV